MWATMPIPTTSSTSRLNRGRDGPKYFLKDYRQVLLADAYGGYNGVVAGNEITRAGCWSHVRRKIIEAEKAAPEIARELIEMVRALYAVEKQARVFPWQSVWICARQQSAPVLAELREKFLACKEQLLPKHPMAEAVNYALGQWEQLNVFCSDGAVPIDNNVAQSFRPMGETETDRMEMISTTVISPRSRHARRETEGSCEV
jgi:transposase